MYGVYVTIIPGTILLTVAFVVFYLPYLRKQRKANQKKVLEEQKLVFSNMLLGGSLYGPEDN